MILNDLSEFIIDCEHKTAPIQDFGYPSIRTPNIGKGKLILEGVNRVSEQTYQDWTKRGKPKAGDLIIAREAPVGNVAIIPEGLDVCLGQRTVLVRPNNSLVHSRYLCYLLLGNELQEQIHSKTNGATVAHLNMKDIRNLKISNLPDLPTQKKISSILSAYDDLIENNNQRIKLLEEMAEEIYKEWFVRMRFPGYKDSKFFDADCNEVPPGTVGSLPEGWNDGTIGDLIEIKKGKNITQNTITEGDVPVVAGGLTPAYYHNTPNTKSPTITISASGANAGYVNLYYEDIWVSDCSFIDTTMTEALFFFYSILKIRQKEVFHLQKGSAQPHVYPKDIMSLKLKYPDPNLLYKFESLIKPFYEEIGILRNKNKVLQETRDLLLPRLISGKLSLEDIHVENTIISAMAAEPEMAYK